MFASSERGGVWKWVLNIFLVLVLLACVGDTSGSAT